MTILHLAFLVIYTAGAAAGGWSLCLWFHRDFCPIVKSSSAKPDIRYPSIQ